MRHWGIFDNENQDVVIGFGFNYPGYFLYYNDVWALNLTSLAWREITPVGVNIEGRRGSCAACDPFHHRIFVFGGDQYYDYYFGDTYILTLDGQGITENLKSSLITHPYIKIVSNPVKLPCQINVFVPFSKNGISLKVYDNAGRIVKTLIKGDKCSGNLIIFWDGIDDKGMKVSSGNYFIILSIDEEIVCEKLILLK
jgi:hypothetical protein